MSSILSMNRCLNVPLHIAILFTQFLVFVCTFAHLGIATINVHSPYSLMLCGCDCLVVMIALCAQPMSYLWSYIYLPTICSASVRPHLQKLFIHNLTHSVDSHHTNPHILLPCLWMSFGPSYQNWWASLYWQCYCHMNAE